MLTDIEYPESCEYRTNLEFEPINFFTDALPESNSMDLLLGYFSSSALNVLSTSFARFIYNGGKVRMVINNLLAIRDKDAINKGFEVSESDFDLSPYNFHKIKSSLDVYNEHFFNCLAWLIASKRIEIVAIRPKGKKGISHYKSGILSDGRDKVRFKGSANFTASALLENLEEIDIKRSWVSETERIAIEEFQNIFNSYFYLKEDGIEQVPFSEIEGIILNYYGNKDLNELLIEEGRLLGIRKEKFKNNRRLKKQINKLEEDIKNIIHTPRFPYSSAPREYQQKAYENWINNDYHGIFAMATGTGKTITSLNCLLNEYYTIGQYKALILVPTKTLALQWEAEIGKFNIKQNIIKVSSAENWKKELSNLTTFLSFGGNKSFIVISTYASFYRPAFQKFLNYLPKDTILIADEAHNIASPKVKEVLPKLKLQKKIALSATPKRIYDPEGSEEMEKFFQDSEPYVYNFSMEEAIEKRILCQYNYYPHVATLTDEELEDYLIISKKLLQFFDFETQSFRHNEIAQQLLMKRKRIVHKAFNKLSAFKGIIKEEYLKRGHLKYTFVYVPEGYDYSNQDEFFEDEEGIRIINQYNRAVMELSDSLRVTSYLGETSDKEGLLKSFERGDVDVLTSIKCLDEGVDVPRAELAIFCSSTGNPRQFIQRRGRILRNHKDKAFAVIHDLVVVPNFNSSSETYLMERSLVERELERVAHFAFMSRNQYEAIESLSNVCDHYDLNIYSLHDRLKGNDNE